MYRAPLPCLRLDFPSASELVQLPPSAVIHHLPGRKEIDEHNLGMLSILSTGKSTCFKINKYTTVDPKQWVDSRRVFEEQDQTHYMRKH